MRKEILSYGPFTCRNDDIVLCMQGLIQFSINHTSIHTLHGSVPMHLLYSHVHDWNTYGSYVGLAPWAWLSFERLRSVAFTHRPARMYSKKTQ